MRRVVYGVIVFTALALLPACDDDPTTPAPAGQPTLLPLTTREAVLNNIEYAYNARQIDPIDALLDDNFTFFFSPGDVGGSIPEQWSRIDEYEATRDLFISNVQPVPVGPVCESIHVDVGTGGIRWIAIIPEGYPDETWYIARASYAFTFEMEPDLTYLTAPGDSAYFVVRQVEVGNKKEWRLIEWRDLGNSLTGSVHNATSSESTWGGVKALYR
jgi:hypothetical protein